MKFYLIISVIILLSCEKRKNIDHPNFSSVLTVATGKISYDLRFGFSPIASDGYDQGIDKYAPPPPPSPFFDAALWWKGERYYTQIVKGNRSDLIEHVWDIKLAFPPSNLITLSWDSNSLKGLGTFFIQDGIDGSQINVDMSKNNSIKLSKPIYETIKIKVKPSNPTSL